jgi:hypothetical protein
MDGRTNDISSAVWIASNEATFSPIGSHLSFLVKQITNKSNTQRKRVTDSPPDFLMAVDEYRLL